MEAFSPRVGISFLEDKGISECKLWEINDCVHKTQRYTH